jgi:hypothetical protein
MSGASRLTLAAMTAKSGSEYDLYWLPLGAGGQSVRLNGRVFEAVAARLARRCGGGRSSIRSSHVTETRELRPLECAARGRTLGFAKLVERTMLRPDDPRGVIYALRPSA